MNNPYDIIGVPYNATREQINAAYREKARKYNEAGQLDKLDELNEAYDRIILEASSSGASGGYSSRGSYSAAGLRDIESRINSGRIEDAQVLLDGIPEESRNAEWYYLKGLVFQKKGWLEQALNMFATASNMEPENGKYRAAYNKLNSQQYGGYKSSGRSSSDSDCGCSVCNMCMGLLCLDSCCECAGGDCIPGC